MAYWRNAPFEKAREMPAEGVRVSVEKGEEEFEGYYGRWFRGE